MIPFTAGRRFGEYEIRTFLSHSPQESYRAIDTETGREVRIRVLTRSWLSRPEANTSLEREIRMLRALRHEKIAPLFNISAEESILYAVSEMLEGESLRQRLQSGPLAPRKAADLAAQIARALEGAHSAGVIHGDLKPENIWLLPDGHVKLLDFGLDNFRYDEILPTDESENLIADYAAPEQVRNEPETPQSDIYSFGCVLYELLTGKRPFLQDSLVATTQAILTEDIPELPPATPPALERIVRHCTRKNPANRFQSASDVAFAIEAFGNLIIPQEHFHRRQHRNLAGVLAALVAALMCGGVLGIWTARHYLRPVAVDALLFQPVSNSGHDSAPASSPDGKTVAFTSDRTGSPRIWLLDIAQGKEKVLTAGPDRYPRWSPDGKTLAFVRQGAKENAIYLVSVANGTVRKLIDGATEADWSPDGKELTWIRPRLDAKVLHAFTVGTIQENGQNNEEIAQIDGQTLLHPRWSPDGQRIAVVAIHGADNHQSILIAHLTGGESAEQYFLPPPPGTGAISAVSWNPNGNMLFYFGAQNSAGKSDWSGGFANLIRQDAKAGTAVTIGFSDWSPEVADMFGPGKLLFDSGPGRKNLQEVTAAGNTAQRRFLTLGKSSDQDPAYTPDGKSILFSSYRGGTLAIWRLDRQSGATRRLTDSPASDVEPFGTHDGKRLLWSSNREGHYEIYSANIDGGYPGPITHDGVDAEFPSAPEDGNWIIYNSFNPKRRGVWKVRPNGVEDTLLAKGNTYWPEVSPNGNYVVYTRVEGPLSRCLEVVPTEGESHVVFTVPLPLKHNAVSQEIGRAHWMGSGRALAFLGQDDRDQTAVFAQQFTPGRDSAATRHQMVGPDAGHIIESFAVSPDNSYLTLTAREQFSNIMQVDNVPGAALRKPR